MVAEPVSLGCLGPLCWYFGPQGQSDHAGVLREVRAALLHKDVHLWLRSDIPLTGYPFKLCGTVDPRLAFIDQQALVKAFCETPTCCLDPNFSHKARPLPRALMPACPHLAHGSRQQ